CPNSPGGDISKIRLRNSWAIHELRVISAMTADFARLAAPGSDTGVCTVSQTLDQQNGALDAAGVAKTFSDTSPRSRAGRFSSMSHLLRWALDLPAGGGCGAGRHPGVLLEHRHHVRRDAYVTGVRIPFGRRDVDRRRR